MKPASARTSITAEGHMMYRLTILIAASLSAAAPAIAHAAPDLSRPVRLAEVSADPRDGADTIPLRGLRDFTHLELRAREARVEIRGLGLRLRDGSVEWLPVRARIAPGDQRTVELPYDARRADAIVVDYGDPELRRRDRTPARLELYGATAYDRDRGRGEAQLRERELPRWERPERSDRWDRARPRWRGPA
jgi:hypothetical protein